MWSRFFHHPAHPYTRALLQSIPRIDTLAGTRLGFIEGAVPDPFEKMKGCPFFPRCTEADGVKCSKNRTAAPRLIEIEPGHKVACYLHYEDAEGE